MKFLRWLRKWCWCRWRHADDRCFPTVWGPTQAREIGIPYRPKAWHCRRCHPCGETFSALLTVLVICSCLAGCAGRTVVRIIPADRAVRFMPAGQPFTPAVDSWAVPNARMLEILERGLLSTNSPSAIPR